MDESQMIEMEFPINGTYYDLLAVLCSMVNNMSQAVQRRVYQLYVGHYKKCCEWIATKCPFLLCRNAEKFVLYSELSYDNAIDILKLTMCDGSEEKRGVSILAIIDAVEKLLDLQHNLKTFLIDKKSNLVDGDISDEYFSFTALNLNTMSKYGKLLPRETCIWERGKDRNADTVAGKPLSILKKHLWIAPNNELNIVNLYTDFNLGKDNHLKVVFSPVSPVAPFRTIIPENEITYEIEYYEDCNQQIEKRVSNVIDYATKEGANIVFFPELMASPKSINSCIEWIKEKWDCELPNLILLPSCEYQQEGRWKNELNALDCEGNVIFKYNKQHRFDLELEDPETKETIEHRFEPIEPDDKIYILHEPNVGRIGFLICSDIFEDGYLDYLFNELKITLLIYSIFSKGKDLMERAAKKSPSAVCDIVLCNTCAAWNKTTKELPDRKKINVSENNFIYRYIAAGHSDYDKNIMSKITCDVDKCDGCAFVLDISNHYHGQITMPSHHRLGGENCGDF